MSYLGPVFPASLWRLLGELSGVSVSQLVWSFEFHMSSLDSPALQKFIIEHRSYPHWICVFDCFCLVKLIEDAIVPCAFMSFTDSLDDWNCLPLFDHCNQCRGRKSFHPCSSMCGTGPFIALKCLRWCISGHRFIVVIAMQRDKNRVRCDRWGRIRSTPSLMVSAVDTWNEWTVQDIIYFCRDAVSRNLTLNMYFGRRLDIGQSMAAVYHPSLGQPLPHLATVLPEVTISFHVAMQLGIWWVMSG